MTKSRGSKLRRGRGAGMNSQFSSSGESRVREFSSWTRAGNSRLGSRTGNTGKSPGRGGGGSADPKISAKTGNAIPGNSHTREWGPRRDQGVIPKVVHFLGISEQEWLSQWDFPPWILGFVGFSNGAFGKTEEFWEWEGTGGSTWSFRGVIPDPSFSGNGIKPRLIQFPFLDFLRDWLCP